MQGLYVSKGPGKSPDPPPDCGVAQSTDTLYGLMFWAFSIWSEERREATIQKGNFQGAREERIRLRTSYRNEDVAGRCHSVLHNQRPKHPEVSILEMDCLVVDLGAAICSDGH